MTVFKVIYKWMLFVESNADPYYYLGIWVPLNSG
jgi:hypothetical protein